VPVRLRPSSEGEVVRAVMIAEREQTGEAEPANA
jgi:hypothetical protein